MQLAVIHSEENMHDETNGHLYIGRRNYNEFTRSSSPSSKAKESFEVPDYRSSHTVSEQYYMQHSTYHQLDFGTCHIAQEVIN